MASRSLGTLTLDLIAKTAGFVSGMTAAERSADKATKKIKGAFGGLKGAITGAIAGVSIAATIRAIVDNTVEAENALRQLEARLKSTGGVAGVTSQELQDFSKELQSVTTFGDDAIIAMQGVLLTFTNIRGNTVKDATRAILDLSTALGKDLQSSAVLVGKALNDPVKGAAALAKAGVQLSAAEKQLIKDLVAVGDVASAQQVVLQKLTTQFGGAAEAAANTFGGSLTQLKNAFGDLLEADGGLNDTTASIQELTTLLRDPGTIAAAQTLTGAIITAFKGVTEAITGTVNVVRFLGEEIASEIGGAAIDDIVRLEEELEEVMELRRTGLADSDFLNRLRFFGPKGAVEWYSNEELDEVIKEIQGKIAAARAAEEARAIAPGAVAGTAPTPPGTPPAPPGTALQEIRITIPKRDTDALAKFYEDLDKLTETQTEKALASYAEQREALEQLWLRGLIGAETYNARLEEINDDLLPEIEVTVKKIPPVWAKATEEISEFQKQAARNTQDIIGDTVLGGIEGRKQDVIEAFRDMINQLVAQALAADLAGKLFGEAGGGTKGSTGFIDQIFGYIGGLFGGGKAAGGPVYPGTAYPVGERGPELFMPRAAGTIIPNHQLARAGGGNVTQIIQVTGTVNQRTARQLNLESARQQRIAQARFGG